MSLDTINKFLTCLNWFYDVIQYGSQKYENPQNMHDINLQMEATNQTYIANETSRNVPLTVAES